MAVFYSFHYVPDHWRVQQVRNIGAIQNDGAIASQEWEKVRYLSTNSIKNWIDTQMSYKRAVVVLIGQETASRDWVQYEIKRAWNLKKPLLGIRIHGLKNQRGLTTYPGEDPFQKIGLRGIPVFTPTGTDSQTKYRNIQENLNLWINQGYRRP